jgi:phosphocarrier protein
MADFDDCPETVLAEGALVREMVIQNKKGLHARATAKFVQTAGRFDAAITVTRCGETVGGTSIMGILTLGAGLGTRVILSATGPEAKQALEAITSLIADKFGEGE